MVTRLKEYKQRKSALGGKKMNGYKFKPIQATPELSGKDAELFIEQVFTKPSQKEIERNERLLKIINKRR
ncbi:hypothetical protein M1I50_09430 [Clostridioides difficile]|uniref:hypothetical protein n=1 Tax=Clostridioides difficile TaxID=1496 RepID=UPI000D1F8DF3|nr:hypothetical protein [Clostridioides difficile]KAK2245299.1 hypothetical protein XC29_00200 [Clostridioides difficile]MBY1968880.1 hypothetical protein [Clostridioides difficile]MBY2508891.1 hypothetical protein [Clostridioides difficile]MBZ4494406.1 hypothetical protein [Clostridioides difficile]MCL0943204.1 hypothetical protein [Clostridioides difficile]